MFPTRKCSIPLLNIDCGAFQSHRSLVDPKEGQHVTVITSHRMIQASHSLSSLPTGDTEICFNSHLKMMEFANRVNVSFFFLIFATAYFRYTHTG